MKKTVTRIALVTGATGFLGGALLQQLLRDPLTEWHAVITVRSKCKRKTWYRKRQVRVSCEQRVKNLVAKLGLSREQASRLHYIEASFDGPFDSEKFFESIQLHIEKIGSPQARLDAVFHFAAHLHMDNPLMTREKIGRIRKNNLNTNVVALESFCGSLEGFGKPENVRILRPSIVCGARSTNGIMAFVNYFDKRILGIRMAFWSKVAMRLCKTIPVLGKKDTIMDVIDIKDVVDATLELFYHDCANFSNVSRFGVLYHCSTAYVHGKQQGILREEPVYSRAGQEYHNAYEESKAMAEQGLQDWARGTYQLDVQYHHLTNTKAPTLYEINQTIYNLMGLPKANQDRLQYCSSIEDFEALIRTIRPKFLADIYKSFWTRGYSLLPYMLRDEGTRFDCEQTERILNHQVSTSMFNPGYLYSAT